MANLKGASVTWLGHSVVLITTPKGTNILIDPFIEGNPKFPKGYQLPEKIDLVLVTHGHFDHILDAAPVAKKYNATAVGAMELALWLKSKGVEKIAACNLGGSYRYEDVTITLTLAHHSSGIQDENGNFVYGAVPVGFVIAIDNGPVLYNTGDTCVFSDIQLIRDLHQPEFIMLPIGDHYTMGPKAAALAIKFSGAQEVLPLHWGTLPELVGTPAELEKQLAAIGLSAVQVHTINPGDTIR